MVFNSCKSKKKKITFLDSFKKFPISIEQIATTYILDIKNGEIDYNRYREIGYKPTKEEIEYINNDTEIAYKALELAYNINDTSRTSASSAFKDFKSDYDERYFQYIMPTLDLITDDDIRKSYKGGFTYLMPDYKNKVIKNVLVLDINSMYPWAMYNCILPYGVPRYFNGKYNYNENYPLYIQHIKAMFHLKQNHIPAIGLKNIFMFATEYITETDEEIDLFLTKPDLELLFEQYDIDYIEYIDGYEFKGMIGIFNDFIERNMKIKRESTGGMRYMAKLRLNSCYGKTALNPRRRTKHVCLENDELLLINGDEEIKEPIYTACAAFITAYCRKNIIENGQKYYDRIIYFDTDSMHLKGFEIPEDLFIDDVELGAFKIEEKADRAKYIRAKTYIHETNDELLIKCAGMPKECHKYVTFDNFKPGAIFPGKLIGRAVKGGYVLKETTFKIKE